MPAPDTMTQKQEAKGKCRGCDFDIALVGVHGVVAPHVDVDGHLCAGSALIPKGGQS